MKGEVTILVVEDEFLIRWDLVLGVEDAGYRAKEASSAGEAIGVLENDPSIRVIITDIGMPGTMDGVALAHYVHERWPPMDYFLGLSSRTALRRAPRQHAASETLHAQDASQIVGRRGFGAWSMSFLTNERPPRP